MPPMSATATQSSQPQFMSSRRPRELEHLRAALRQPNHLLEAFAIDRNIARIAQALQGRGIARGIHAALRLQFEQGERLRRLPGEDFEQRQRARWLTLRQLLTVLVLHVRQKRARPRLEIRHRFNRITSELKSDPAWGAVPSPLLPVPNLLAQISLIADFFNLMQLGFEPIDVPFLIFQEPLEEFARCVVALIPSDLNRSVVHRHRVQFQLEIALDLLLDILPDVDVQQLGHAGRRIEEQNSLDEYLGVLHLVDGLLLDERSELVVLPVLTHLRVRSEEHTSELQ